MARRTVLIQSYCKLSVSNKRLIVAKDSGEVSVPLSEIWVLILEAHACTVTVALLSSLAEAGIGVMTCGPNHMPIALHLPIGAHSRHSAIVEHQLLISAPLRKRLWQRIVQAKIENQADCLRLLGRDPGGLDDKARSVRSGDAGGAEAAAAAEYFRRALPEGTRRSGPYEGPLDYGYAVVRASIARCCVGGGWLVSRGIHHDSGLNAFNLVDDLIEPFRPFVDRLVLSEGIVSPLRPPDKVRLASVLEAPARVGGEETSLQRAAELLLDSFKRAVLEKDPSRLLLPSFMETERER